MGLFDDLTNKAQGLFAGAGGQGLGGLKGVMDMLSNNESGGLSGLIQSFKDKGLGDVISSWIGTGQNMPVNPDQITDVLGNETVQNMAEKAGVSSSEMSSQLAQNLPGLIDKLTPDGVVPEGGLLEKGIEFLKGKLS